MQWIEKDNQLTRSFTFRDFAEAWRFMEQVARVAEEMDHHPDWTNVYNRVDFRLCTHSAGNTVTARDYTLATAIDRIHQSMSA